MPQVLRMAGRQTQKIIIMVKKIILSAFVLAIAVTVQAQEIPERKSEKPGMMHKKRHHQGMELKSLNLSEDQKAKFKAENENFRSQMAELKKNETITVKEWKDRSEKIRKQHKTNIQNLLTPEQKVKMQEMRKEGKARHEEGMKGKLENADRRKGMTDLAENGDRKARAEKMKAELGLTADQAAKMEANHKALAKNMKAIRENDKLTTEEKKEQVKELHKKQKESLKSILTQEQLQKLKEQKPPARDGMRKRTEKEKTI